MTCSAPKSGEIGAYVTGLLGAEKTDWKLWIFGRCLWKWPSDLKLQTEDYWSRRLEQVFDVVFIVLITNFADAELL